MGIAGDEVAIKHADTRAGVVGVSVLITPPAMAATPTALRPASSNVEALRAKGLKVVSVKDPRCNAWGIRNLRHSRYLKENISGAKSWNAQPQCCCGWVDIAYIPRSVHPAFVAASRAFSALSKIGRCVSSAAENTDAKRERGCERGCECG